MNDKSLKDFLKAHASKAPEADYAESSRIWAHIQAERPRRIAWILFPTLVTSLVAVVFLQFEKAPAQMNEEEVYLQQEWAEMQSEVDAEIDQEFVTVFEK